MAASTSGSVGGVTSTAPTEDGAADCALDAIVDCDAELSTGTGILYDTLDAEALVAAVQRALALVTSPKSSTLVSRIMRRDLGWDRPARRYLHVYRQALAAKT